MSWELQVRPGQRVSSTRPDAKHVRVTPSSSNKRAGGGRTRRRVSLLSPCLETPATPQTCCACRSGQAPNWMPKRVRHRRQLVCVLLPSLPAISARECGIRWRKWARDKWWCVLVDRSLTATCVWPAACMGVETWVEIPLHLGHASHSLRAPRRVACAATRQRSIGEFLCFAGACAGFVSGHNSSS